jgi:hypothetical protein
MRRCKNTNSVWTGTPCSFRGDGTRAMRPFTCGGAERKIRDCAVVEGKQGYLIGRRSPCWHGARQPYSRALPQNLSEECHSPLARNSFPSGLAEDPSTRLADEVCRLRQAQRSAGPSVAVVIGRHDSRPLSPAAKKCFRSNLGLAQKRAETIARLLLDKTTCSDSRPIDAIALAVPNDRSVPRSMLDEQRRHEVVGLRIVLQTK